MKLKIVVVGFFFMSWHTLLYARTFQVDRIRSDDTLEKIAQRNLKKVKNKYGNDYQSYIEDIKRWNPNITNWYPPPVDQKVYVDYPFNEYVSGSSYAPALGSDDGSTEYGRQASLNFFFASSVGSYSEKTKSQTVTSGQNFPYSFGLAFSSSDESREHFVVGSFYWAKGATGSVTNTDGSKSEIKTEGEIGGNFYYQYYFPTQNFGFYSGYDYEKLNTFNTSEILVGSKLKNVANHIHYGTLGLVKGFSPFNLRINLKASISKSLSSNTTRGEALEGLKYIVNANYMTESNMSFGFFYKHHALEGSTKLDINRYALTVGFFFY